MTAREWSQDDLYTEAAGVYGAALERLARAYEIDPELRRDLLQEIHIALWRSFGGFDGRCSLRTWVYRVAHNAAASHVLHQRRTKVETLVGLDELASVVDDSDAESAADRGSARVSFHKPVSIGVGERKRRSQLSNVPR